MKILLMALQFPPAPVGGAEKQCWEQARTLAARGHDVTVLTEWWIWGSARNETKEGVRILRLGFGLPLVTLARGVHDRLVAGWRSLAWRRQICSTPAAVHLAAPPRKRFRFMAPIEWLGQLSFILEVAWALKTRQWSVDAVHVHESHWLAGFAHWVAEKLKVPAICTEHNGRQALEWPGMPDVPGLARWGRRRRGCLFLAISPATRLSLEEQGIPPSQIVDVQNGVPVPDRQARVAEQNEIIYLGNFTQGAAKAFDVLLLAWGKVHGQEPAARLHMYGGGDAAPWKRFAQVAGCEDSVVFAGTTDHVMERLLDAGLFVLPSRWEGLSMALLEAQAAGLPAVVSDIEGNRAVVKDGANGLVVGVGEVDALAEAILKLYRDPDLRRRMGQAARERIVRHFSIEKVVERLEMVYEQAIGRGASMQAPPLFQS